MSITSSVDSLKTAIFNAIEHAFNVIEEPLMPVIMSYQGSDGIVEIIAIDPEIAKNPAVLLEYCNHVIPLEQALSQFVIQYLIDNQKACMNGCEGSMEFDARYRTITLIHSSYELVLKESAPVFI